MITERDDKFLKKLGLETWGTNSLSPQPLIECDVSEFWSMFSQYGARDIEFRQMTVGEKHNQNCHIVVYYDRAFVISVKQTFIDGKYLSIPTIYRAGCVHKYDSEILDSRRGDIQMTCKKCGHSYKDNCGD